MSSSRSAMPARSGASSDLVDVFRVGLTGNVASGKSSVARAWADRGAPVIDADVLAREAVAPGTTGLDRVRETFGQEVMDGQSLDRAALRRIVFGDDDARSRLEAIVHPEVARLREAREQALGGEGAAIVVHDIPLLFEVGLQDEFDMIVLVDAPREVRAERLVRDRGLDREEARRLIGSQMPSSSKRGRADLVIDNTGTLTELEAEAAAVWREIQRRAGVAAGAAGSPGAPATVSSDGSPGERIRIDLHIHTRTSFDCRSDPEAVVERALEAGLSRIAITDHNQIEAALALAERYPDVVIPGEEVKTGGGVDITGLFVRERIPKGTPARETCERIRDQGGIVYVPHPFAGGKGGGGRILPEIEDLVDAVEGFNARLHDASLNDRAKEWARARGLPLGAGSDAHTLGEIGHAWTDVPAFENTPEGLLAALARGTVHGRESSRLVHIASTVAKLLP